MSKPVFKPYEPNQIFLLPPSIEEMISPAHPVRVVDAIIEKININPLIKLYKGGGTSSYHPKMLLKVLVYSYLKNIYSSRKMEELLYCTPRI
jgi:transposase